MSDNTFKHNAPVNRLRASLPKIGIRPVIDGRQRGVRESLEGQVMGMARTAAEFLSKNITHACGLPVECVIADTCIGGVSEAAKCAEKFARAGVGLSLTVTPCWCYGAETLDMDRSSPRRWGFNGTGGPGRCISPRRTLPEGASGVRNSQDAGRRRYVHPRHAEKMLQLARAGLAAATMRGIHRHGRCRDGHRGSIVNTISSNRAWGCAESVDLAKYPQDGGGIFDPEEFRRALAKAIRKGPRPERAGQAEDA